MSVKIFNFLFEFNFCGSFTSFLPFLIENSNNCNNLLYSRENKESPCNELIEGEVEIDVGEKENVEVENEDGEDKVGKENDFEIKNKNEKTISEFHINKNEINSNNDKNQNNIIEEHFNEIWIKKMNAIFEKLCV